MMNKIESVSCVEPSRNEYPTYARVGCDHVTLIEYEEHNLGTYGIGWFNIYKGDFIDRKINALVVTHVTYFKPEG